MTREKFGPYLLLKKLCEDPLGETFRAGRIGQQSMEQVVLLRVFNGSALEGSDLWSRVSDRATVQQALRSPNIGTGVDLGEVRGVPYFAYDYISGKSLGTLFEQVVKRSHPVPADHALLMAERMALGLAVAYETRVESERLLHGFLIPHLILLSNEGEIRILGFEVAPGLTQLATEGALKDAFGRYLSPEVLAGKPRSKTDDVYSLGVILLEFLLGKSMPFPNTAGQAEVLAELRQRAPAAVAELIEKSVAPASDRIEDVLSWHRILSRILIDGEHKSTTFNLAFFMHNLFREDIEKESREIEVEKTMELPVLPATRGSGVQPVLDAAVERKAAQPALDPAPAPKAPIPVPGPAPPALVIEERPSAPQAAETDPSPPEQAASPASADNLEVHPQDSQPSFPALTPLPGIEQQKAPGFPWAIAAAVVAVLSIGGASVWFFGLRSQDAKDPQATQTAAQPVAEPTDRVALDPVSTDIAEPAPAPGPTAEELQAQIDELVAARAESEVASIKAEFDAKLAAMQRQLEAAQAKPKEPQPAAKKPDPPEVEPKAASVATTEPPAKKADEGKGGAVSEEDIPEVEAPRNTRANEPQRARPETNREAYPKPAETQTVESQIPETEPVRRPQATSVPATTTAAVERVRLGELVQPGPGVIKPERVSELAVRYPMSAKRLQKQAIVVLEVLVDEDGRVLDVKAQNDPGYGFKEAAEAAARKARYRPATKNGVRVRMWMALSVNFKL